MKEKIRPWLWAILILLLWCAPARALRVEEDDTPKAYGYVMWHEKYFLVAARVQDSLLVGTSQEPQVFPGNDDGIELGFDVVGADGRHRYSRLAISAAGGFAAFSRDEVGRWRTDHAWLQPPATIKFSVANDGTLNDPTDRDRYFTIEAAIPWEKLGGQPKGMEVVGFNFLTRVRGENQTFVSWAAGLVTEEDNKNPALWGKMLLFPGVRPSAAEAGILACPKVGRVPFVDGKLGAEEWIGATIITLKKPAPQFEPAPKSSRRREQMPTMLAVYRYDYRRAEAGEKAGVLPALPIHQPREGLGPWWSGQRPGWHRGQLQEIRRAGIDVLLAQYSPAKEARATWSRRGLGALVEALRELRATKRSFATVGLYLDPAGLAEALAQAPLTEARGKEILYGAIREFYEHIPPEFRAEIGLGEKRGYPVVLGPPQQIGDWDEDFIAYVNAAFARDFGGARLVWMADPEWKRRPTAGIAAYPPLGRLPASAHETTEAAVSVLTPGSDDAAGTRLRVRKTGRELREEWRQLLAVNPDFVVINSWNDFVGGSYVAPSRQEGFGLVDALSLLVSEEAEKVRQPLSLKRANFPAAVSPGGRTQYELVLANSSAEVLRTDEKVGLDVRIFSGDGKKRLHTISDIADLSIAPGGTSVVMAPVRAVDASARSLRPGNYIAEFVVRRSSLPYFRSRWLTRELASFRLPLVVGQPDDYAFAVLASSLRSGLKSGAGYEVTLLLRNDGRRTWKRQETGLAYRWVRAADDLEAASEARREDVGGGGGPVVLTKDVAPGETIGVTVPVETAAAGGPLEAWRPGEMWHYALVWDLQVKGQKAATTRAAESGAVYTAREDVGSHFVDSTTPRQMQADESYEVEVILTNSGPDAWGPEETALTYHWYFWDGEEAIWDAAPQALTRAVPPGGSLQVTAQVHTPAYGGAYYLMWDVKQGENFASKSAPSHNDEMLLVPVTVAGGRCVPVDLAEHLNIIAAAGERRRASGDFDGLGNSFPLEEVPADLTGNVPDIYPSGYYVGENGRADELHWVGFRYPQKSSGLMKGLACVGQSVALPEVPVRRLHILGAGTGAGLRGEVTVNFADGSREARPLEMSSWLAPGRHGESVGFRSPYMRTTRGDNAQQRAYLHHYIIDIEGGGPAVSLTLPDNIEMKIVAITMEGAPLAEDESSDEQPAD